MIYASVFLWTTLQKRRDTLSVTSILFRKPTVHDETTAFLLYAKRGAVEVVSENKLEVMAQFVD